MKRTLLLLLLTALLLAAAPSANAVMQDGNRYGLGLQWFDPVDFGPSFTFELADLPLSIQAILGTNDFPSPVGRVRLAFYQRQYFDGYAYGALGFRTWDGPEGPNGDDDGDVDMFGGVGGGVEWDWRQVDEGLPPVSWSLELGYAYDDISFGFGIHYTF